MDVEEAGSLYFQGFFVLEEYDDLTIRGRQAGGKGQGQRAFVLCGGLQVPDNIGMMELAACVLSLLYGGGGLQLYEGGL